MWGIVAAMTAAVAQQEAALARLPPEERKRVLEKRARRRANEAMESSPEVQLARECIANERLSGEGAARLLEFARDLVRRRTN